MKFLQKLVPFGKKQTSVEPSIEKVKIHFPEKPLSEKEINIITNALAGCLQKLNIGTLHPMDADAQHLTITGANAFVIFLKTIDIVKRFSFLEGGVMEVYRNGQTVHKYFLGTTYLPGSNIVLKRFNGDEVWQITDASFSIAPAENSDKSVLNFWAQSEHGSLLSKPLEDTYVDGGVTIEIDLKVLPSDDKLVGKIWTLPESKEETEDYYSNFYCYEHEFLSAGTFKVLSEKEGYFQVELRATCTDPNYYDGSKPETTIVIESWIKKQDLKFGYWT